MYKPNIVYYHYPCSDGITAAAIVHEVYFGNDDITFIPFDYGNKRDIMEHIDECRDKRVLMVDCSFKTQDLQRVMQSAEHVMMIDHHAGTFDDLQEFFVGSYVPHSKLESLLKDSKASLIFDNAHSGAGLCWTVFNPDKKMPAFVEYIEDVDINRLSLENVTAFRSWSRSLPFDISVIEMQIAKYATRKDMAEVFASGRAIEQYVNTRVAQTLTNMQYITLNDQQIPYVITDYAFASDCANMILQENKHEQLAIAFYFSKKGLGASIRSKTGVDASAFAKAFGGNGHRQAAGFNIPWQDIPGYLQVLEDQGSTIFHSE